MKPKTKAQIEVFNLSQIVLNVADKIKEWAFLECNEHIGLATKNKFWCIDCGEEHSIDLVENDNVVCPSCNSKLKIIHSLKRSFFQSYYVAFAEVLGDYQVIRLFEVMSRHKKYKNAEIIISENIQQYIPSDHSKIQFVARACNMGGYEPRYGNLEVRKPHIWKERQYNPLPLNFHPESLFKAEYNKIGIDHNLQGLTFLTAYKTLSYSQAETLLKAKQYSLFNYIGVESTGKVLHHWPSIKIAIRNNFQVNDASLWLDYLDLLEFFTKDTRSPKFLFPNDLNNAHDRLVAKKRKLDQKKEIELKKKRLVQDQLLYTKKIQLFKGLNFSKGKLTIKLLETVQEFIQESDTHKHCVYTNEYFKKEDSLIFSASFNGEMVETVELSISKLKILQSRGLQNQSSKYNKSIIKLMEDNLYQIEERLFKIQNTA